MIGQRGFTGRHMLAVMVGFFGIVIAVNVAMVNKKWFQGLAYANARFHVKRWRRQVDLRC